MLTAFKRLGLFLVGFSLPIQGYSFLDFSFGMTPFKVATAILLVIGLLEFVVFRRKFPHDRKRWWMVAFLASSAIACVTGLGSGAPLPSVLIATSTHLSVIVYYFLIGYVVRSRRDLMLILWALLIGGGVTAAPAVLGLEQGSDGMQGARYMGLAGQENLFGFDMAMCLPVGMGLFFSTRSFLGRGLALGFSISCVLGLFLSLSRSAFVSLAVMGAFWMVRSTRAESFKYIVPVLAIVVGLAIVAPRSVMERVDTMVNPERRADDGSIQSRFLQARLALRAVASSPIVGVGVLGFIPWSQRQPGGFGNEHDVHNAYLGLVAEQGLPGPFLFVALLLLTWGDYSRCIREVRARRRQRDFSLAEVAHCATFLQLALLGGMVGGMFGMAQWSKTLWLVLALSPVLVSLCRARILELEPPHEDQVGFKSLDFRSAGSPSGSVWHA